MRSKQTDLVGRELSALFVAIVVLSITIPASVGVKPSAGKGLKLAKAVVELHIGDEVVSIPFEIESSDGKHIVTCDTSEVEQAIATSGQGDYGILSSGSDSDGTCSLLVNCDDNYGEGAGSLLWQVTYPSKDGGSYWRDYTLNVYLDTNIVATDFDPREGDTLRSTYIFGQGIVPIVKCDYAYVDPNIWAYGQGVRWRITDTIWTPFHITIYGKQTWIDVGTLSFTGDSPWNPAWLKVDASFYYGQEYPNGMDHFLYVSMWFYS